MNKLILGAFICAASAGVVASSTSLANAVQLKPQAPPAAAIKHLKHLGDEWSYSDASLEFVNKTADTLRVRFDDREQELAPGKKVLIDPGTYALRAEIPKLWPKAPGDTFFTDIDDGLLFNSVKMGYDWVSKGKRHTKVFYNEWSSASRECWKDTVVDGCRTFKINAAKIDHKFEVTVEILDSKK